MKPELFNTAVAVTAALLLALPGAADQGKGISAHDSLAAEPSAAEETGQHAAHQGGRLAETAEARRYSVTRSSGAPQVTRQWRQTAAKPDEAPARMMRAMPDKRFFNPDNPYAPGPLISDR
ncbi:hypothetical protein FGK63_03145 [Ruegeria sediminis]|uniref:Uncharacterized protein n=1 Tax=Ruegeria sediminis TaxID=2583820 RepID=A0ABY2X3V2_9RHOB|nr:hypothetical protein [Ruegeria sediminis]TMV10072.1 hypothetical protein FGK63_03145 [Ruegeria sediminis]